MPQEVAANALAASLAGSPVDFRHAHRHENRQAGQVVWSTASLPSGAHTIKVTVLGTHNPASSGTRVDVDAFAAIK